MDMSLPPHTPARATRQEYEQMAARGLRLGARYATIADLFADRLTDNQCSKIASALGVTRVSGQQPRNAKFQMQSHMRLHTSLFAKYFGETNKEHHIGFRIITAWECYARVVASVSPQGDILAAAGMPIGLGGDARDHPAAPRLPLDRAVQFARTYLLTANAEIRMGSCGGCHAPMLLSNTERPATYRCPLCKDRLNAGRPRRTPGQ
ncbi:MAG: hypothetical protein ABL985_05930 [Casimicrobium sp.]